ncbi:MAG: PAS domain S-box protein, partial [Burkholderiales bacterium]|nr:PAS domain S-box protein [Burkholderiales bacterium]
MADADPDRSSRSSTAETAAWNEARYRLLLEGLTDYALIMVSPDGYVLTWNAGAERINGYRADEIVGRHFSCFFPPALVEADAPSEGLRIAAETGHHVSEGWRRRKDGTEIWVTVITRPIRDASGALVGFAKLTHDLTEQKRADSLAAASARRESLLQAERDARMQAQRVVRLKDEFIATLSHELRTPLHAILGWVNILTSGRASADQIAKGLEVIERNARTQSRIIDDLLDEDMLIDNLRLDVRSVDVREVVASTVESIVPTTTAKGLRVEADVSADIGVVNADSARLQQILWNLVTNAVKFTPRGGSIRIAATREVDHVEIRVSDTGQGISSEFMPRIFERHSQEDGAAGSQLGGLGLGLSIAKQLAELHGGTLRGESGGSGHGSTFILTLPVGDDERAVPEHAAMRAAAPRRRE